MPASTPVAVVAPAEFPAAVIPEDTSSPTEPAVMTVPVDAPAADNTAPAVAVAVEPEPAAAPAEAVVSPRQPGLLSSLPRADAEEDATSPRQG